MTLSSIFHALFGGVVSTDYANARQEWRTAVHDSRNQATKALAVARDAERKSDKHYVAIALTLPEQARTSVDREFINRARGL